MTWEGVYRDHWRPVLRWCRERYGSGIDAEGVTQAAMVRVWQQFPTLDISDRLVRWHLLRGAREAAEQRQYRSGAAELFGFSLRSAAAVWAGIGDYLPDDLDPRAAEVCRLVCEEGYTLREAGAMFDRSWGTAQADWRRAVARVKETLES